MKKFNEFSKKEKKKCRHAYLSCIKTEVAIEFLKKKNLLTLQGLTNSANFLVN